MVTNWPLCIVHTVQTVFLLDLSYEGQVTPKMGSAQEKAAVRFVQTRTEFLEESVGDGLGLWGGRGVSCMFLSFAPIWRGTTKHTQQQERTF